MLKKLTILCLSLVLTVSGCNNPNGSVTSKAPTEQTSTTTDKDFESYVSRNESLGRELFDLETFVDDHEATLDTVWPNTALPYLTITFPDISIPNDPHERKISSYLELREYMIVYRQSVSPRYDKNGKELDTSIGGDLSIWVHSIGTISGTEIFSGGIACNSELFPIDRAKLISLCFEAQRSLRNLRQIVFIDPFYGIEHQIALSGDMGVFGVVSTNHELHGPDTIIPYPEHIKFLKDLNSR